MAIVWKGKQTHYKQRKKPSGIHVFVKDTFIFMVTFWINCSTFKDIHFWNRIIGFKTLIFRLWTLISALPVLWLLLYAEKKPLRNSRLCQGYLQSNLVNPNPLVPKLFLFGLKTSGLGNTVCILWNWMKTYQPYSEKQRKQLRWPYCIFGLATSGLTKSDCILKHPTMHLCIQHTHEIFQGIQYQHIWWQWPAMLFLSRRAPRIDDSENI